MTIGLAIGLLAILPSRPASAEADWWSFRPVRRPAVPVVEGQAAVTNPIDAFVREAQAGAGITPSPEADRVALIRRLSIDLRGLPPTPAEADAFLADRRADAYDRLVDRTLASPAFGERQAQKWLDLARYGDTDGYELDGRRPDAWRYRDWVVDALNDDLPFDRFARLQVAADLVAPDEPRHRAALGFLRNGPSVANERGESVRLEELDDVVSTTATAFLGLTVGCARCHDHRADPIPTEDYYRLVAVFAGSTPANLPLVSVAEAARHREATLSAEVRLDAARVDRLAIERPVRARIEAERRSALPPDWREALDRGTVRKALSRQEQADLDARLTIGEAEIAAALSTEQLEAVTSIRARMEAIEASRPAPLARVRGVVDAPGRVDPVHVLIRGDLKRRGAAVRPGPPRAIAGQVVDFNGPPRRALADWIADPSNPLTARVAVNRIWQGHFGRGLVATPSDFGAAGESPAIPRLLDWLAAEFVARGWSRKAIHRLIVTSATYRQSSRVREPMKRIDPDERLVWRYPLRRLEAETIRDAILACAGSLDEGRGGPGVFPPIDPSALRTANRPRWPLDAVDGPAVWRRSLYVTRMRSQSVPFLEAFDQPDPSAPCPVRPTTTTPLQSLAMLNSPFVVAQARRFADRVEKEAGPDIDARIDLAFRIATGRAPSREQDRASAEYLRGPGDLAGLCHVLFQSNAFLSVE